ncbi:MAG TPA: GntR family transcriptional regulator [Gryllotalpicola sp.]
MAAIAGDNAYEGLRTAILGFELLPGERLSERGLETLLGASRTPIRAALVRLEAEGLTQRAGRGWRVAPIDLAEVRAVMEYREALETAAVRLAVERADDDRLALLRARVEAQNGQEDDTATGVRDGADFHVALSRLSGNPFLAEGMGSVLTRLLRARWLSVTTPESRERIRAEHLAILDAVAARDAARAVELVTAHSHGTRDRLLVELTAERRRLRGSGYAIVESAGAQASATA